MSMGGFRSTMCVICGSRFMDDCGDSVCSSSCEREYEREYAPCQECGDEVGEDNLERGLCNHCIEGEEDE